MAYKDDYYSEVDELLDKMKPNPFEGMDRNAVRYEDDGQIQPTGWVENADGTDGAATVKINADGITVTEGAVSVVDGTGNTVIDAGVVKIVNNQGSTVVINASGITVTGGAITVSNGTGTVIIDGTSNMFKIQATGSTSNTIGAFSGTPPSNSGWTDVTLTGLGTQATTPAHLSFVSTTNATTGERVMGRQRTPYELYDVDGFGTSDILAAQVYMDVSTVLNGSSICILRFGGYNISPSSATYYCRYHVLKEAAL